MTSPPSTSSKTTLEPESWVEKYGDDLFGYALLRLRNRSLAEDLVQETLLGAYEGRAGFKGESSERTWLVSILRHKIIDHYRLASRERPAASEQDSDSYFTEAGGWRAVPARWPRDPSRDAEGDEFWQVLDGCLEGLPERQAKAFTLREFDQLESAEICEALQITPANLWVLLHRARLGLRQCLELRWFERG